MVAEKNAKSFPEESSKKFNMPGARKTASTATRKKATRKKKVEASPEESIALNSTTREISGWFLIITSLLFLCSIVMQFASPSGKHVMGEYLGSWLASTLLALFGKVPILLLIATLFISGAYILKFKSFSINRRTPILLTLLFVEFTIMLSIQNQNITQFSKEQFISTGGICGNFLVNFLFSTLFGKSLVFGYVVTGMAMLFSLIWGWRLSPSTWVDKLVIKFTELNYLRKNVKRELEEEYLFEFKKNLEQGNVPPELAKKITTRVKAQEVNDEFVEMPAKVSRNKKKEPEKAEETLPVETTDMPFDFEEQMKKLQEMAESGTLDPRMLRKIRDEQAELRRVAELNQWEDRKKADLKIGGILSKEKKVAQKNKGEEQQENLFQEDEKKTVKIPAVESDMDVPKAKPAIKTALKTKSAVSKNNLNDLSDDTQMDVPPAEAPAEEKTVKKAVAKPKPKPKKEVKYDEYKIPKLEDVFGDVPVQETSYSEEDLHEMSEMLEMQLSNFKVKGKVIGICTGPVITRFEIDLAPGIKVSKISGLADDLALALRASSIRILAPIPGKSAVGIEIPNTQAHIVFCKDVLDSTGFAPKSDNLMIGLGKDIAGDTFTLDLSRAPHLLIAGQTGSGKSVCINTVMASLLFSKSPDELRMILVDPKVVELKPYESIPHLLHPVITDPETAIQALKWSCFEMDRRYEVLAQAGVRNIFSFNAKAAKGKLKDAVPEEERKKMPFLVIVIDELADLMMVAGKEVEVSIARIAQKARAVGIHLILATQRPSTNVITGTIKANLPSRIAFKVASQIDARTILDKMGAEKLLGRGDMLVRSLSDPEPVRAHGGFLTDDEVEKLAELCGDQFVNYPQVQSFSFEDEGEALEDVGPRDDKFNDAAELVVAAGTASTSMLQRRLGIGYARAGKIIDQMEATGIIGPSKGSKAREVLMDETELMSFLSGDVDAMILED